MKLSWLENAYSIHVPPHPGTGQRTLGPGDNGWGQQQLVPGILDHLHTVFIT